MAVVGAGYGGSGAEAADPTSDVGPNEDGKYVTVVDGIRIEADSQEELDAILNYLSLASNKPISELTAHDVTSNIPLGTFNYDVGTRTISLKPEEGKDFLGEVQSGFFGGDVPFFPEGSEAYLGSSYDTDSIGSEAAAGVAGYQGAAGAIYDANYPPGQEPKPLTPEQVEQLDPELVALLKKLFGDDVVINPGHLNVLKSMSLVSGDPSDLGSWALTSGEAGGGELLLAEFREVDEAVANGETPSYFLPSMGGLNITQEDVDASKDMFDKDGNITEDTHPDDVKDAATDLVDGMGSEAGTPLPSDVSVPPGSSEQAMLNALLGKPANNEDFTAEELNAAIALGLITFDPATGKVSITASGTSFMKADETAGPRENKTEEGDPASGEGAYGSYADYMVYIHNQTGIERTTSSREGDEYESREALKSRGFPDWVIDFLFDNFANTDGVIDERTLNSLIENGYLTHENKDSSGRGKDRYGLTEKLVQLIASDPSLTDAQRKEIFITGMAMAEFARDNDNTTVDQSDFYRSAVAHSKDPAVREKYAEEYDKWIGAQTAEEEVEPEAEAA